MSSRTSSVATRTSCEEESCAEESTQPEEAKLTPAQKRKQEAEEKLRKIKERQALHRELPDHDFVTKMAQLSRGRPAHPSWDEIPRKRRRISHVLREKKSAHNTRSIRTPRPKETPAPKGALVGASTSGQDHVPTLGPLIGLPTEIRDEILRYILIWPEDIMLFCGWTRVFPRSRPRLDLSILYTCRLLRDQGLRILYGENQFAYHSRDPRLSHSHSAPVLEKVFIDGMVPIDKYGHLVRYIVLKMDASRICQSQNRQNLEKAILKFLPCGGLAHPPNIHTVTLDIPAQCSSDPRAWSRKLFNKEESSIPDEVRSPESYEVLICRSLQRGSRIHNAILKIQAQWVRVLARDYRGLCWETKIDMRYYAKDEHMKHEHMALRRNEKKWWDMLDNTDDRDHQENKAGSDTDYRPKDVQAMEKLWDREVRKAVARLGNLSKHVEALATEQLGPASERKYWKLLDAPRSGTNRLRDRRTERTWNWLDGIQC